MRAVVFAFTALLLSQAATGQDASTRGHLSKLPEMMGPPLGSGWDEVPRDIFIKGLQGRTAVRLMADPAGRPFRCEVAVTSGVKELDAATCAYILKSWRFKPAYDDQGKAVFASFIEYFKWVNPNSWAVPPTEYRSSDIVLTVNKLPVGGVLGATVFQIREVDGRASACYPSSDTVNKCSPKWRAITCRRSMFPI